MANVEDGRNAAVADTGDQIWGGRQSSGKLTRKRVMAGGALLGAAALAVGLYVGLKDDSSTDRTLITGQADPNSLGCFADTSDGRVMEAQLTDQAMTPDVRMRGRLLVCLCVEESSMPAERERGRKRECRARETRGKQVAGTATS